jgi:hypothetical protein
MLAGPHPTLADGLRLRPLRGRRALSGNTDITVGTNTSVTIVDTDKPPISRIARGFLVPRRSEPSASGGNPDNICNVWHSSSGTLRNGRSSSIHDHHGSIRVIANALRGGFTSGHPHGRPGLVSIE